MASIYPKQLGNVQSQFITLNTSIVIKITAILCRCAAHLGMLCNHALRAYQTYNSTVMPDGTLRQRAFFVNYESLPGIIPQVVLPMFGIEASSSWLQRMDAESHKYSKGKSKSRTFLGDTEEKNRRATKEIEQFGNAILLPSYDEMDFQAEDALKRLSPALWTKLQHSNSDNAIGDTGGNKRRVRWEGLKTIPTELNGDSKDLLMRMRQT